MPKKSLIIVESPAKIKTLKKFLGKDYIFESSLGHVRDLPSREFGIDIENDFTPKYQTLEEKTTVINNIIKAAKSVDAVYLSPDPDREGEAIAWHIAQVLPEGVPTYRVSFNSITAEAVRDALLSPRDIDLALVNAQQARRLLDRMVGYKISPILARRVQRKGSRGSVSAGRVQSVALILVVDREREIEAFQPVEYWNLAVWLHPEEVAGKDVQPFCASLHSIQGKRVEKEIPEGKEDKFITVPSEATALSIKEELEKGPYQVTRIDKKEKKRHPVPPFITSTLQQEASRYYSFSATRTMSIAQTLYEGVDMGTEGYEGLITYMRTDSVRIAPEALSDARSYITGHYGKEYLPPKPRVFSSKKTAQDAHEAIRPTNIHHPPERVRPFLTQDQFRLYTLIWRRFIASQMNPAIYDTISADILAGTDYLLRTTGSVIKFPGFLAVYEEKNDDDAVQDEDKKTLPPLEDGQNLIKDRVTSDQCFTKPPPRYSEASLVKELEKSGIGRPSTYATIMNKIQSRDYTTKESGRLHPTELGSIIAELLKANFTKIMDTGFTALLEDELEQVASNKKDWIALLREFWTGFEPTLEEAEKNAFVPKIATEEPCPKCGKTLQKIWSGSKYFYGCIEYPECDYTSSIEEFTFDKALYHPEFDWDQMCEKCEAPMKVRHGPYGAFLGCTKYPECRHTVHIPKKDEDLLESSDLPQCPAKGCPGNMTLRRSRFGKTFFSCTTFPECDVIVNDLDELGTKYADYERKAYVKKKRGRKPKKGAKKTTTKKKAKKSTEKKAPRVLPPSPLSPELAALVGTDTMPRNEVMKKVWEYIKAKELQGAENKRTIHPDDTLAKVLGSSDPIDMFKMTGAISKHIGKAT